MLEKYGQVAKIPPPGPHVLRHTFATRYLAANPDDLRGLARLLGHANLNTVMIYTEPDMDSLTNRMERVETLAEWSRIYGVINERCQGISRKVETGTARIHVPILGSSRS